MPVATTHLAARPLLWGLLLLGGGPAPAGHVHSPAARFASYVVDPKRQQVQLFWQDERHERFGSIRRLQGWLAQHHRRLVFAMNGGMYNPGGQPTGLFIQHQATRAPLNTALGLGNFYLKPNGVFYLTTGRQAAICATEQFRASPTIAYATQSGPLLLSHGRPHPAFRPGSANLAVRNGVGVRPDGRVVFAISREKVNFYDFAAYFKRLGCTDALYLDGFVSRMYLPAEGWQQTDGDFGVIVGVSVAADY